MCMLTSKKDHWSQTKRQDNAVSNGSFPLLHTKIGLYSKGSKGQSVGEVNITSIKNRRQAASYQADLILISKFACRDCLSMHCVRSSDTRRRRSKRTLTPCRKSQACPSGA